MIIKWIERVWSSSAKKVWKQPVQNRYCSSVHPTIDEMLDQATLQCCSITKHKLVFFVCFCFFSFFLQFLPNMQEGKLLGEGAFAGLALIHGSKVLTEHMSSNVRTQVCSSDSQPSVDDAWAHIYFCKYFSGFLLGSLQAILEFMKLGLPTCSSLICFLG